MHAVGTLCRALRPLASVVIASVLVPSAVGCARPMPAPHPDGDGIDVRHYDLAMRLDPVERHVQARVRIDVQHVDTLTSLPLAFDALQVDSVLVDGVPVASRHEDGVLHVPLAGMRETTSVEVVYRGVPPEGLYAGEHEGRTVVYTDSWPDRGRGWMPGVHHPSDPATFSLTLDVPAGYEAVGTGTPVPAAARNGWMRYAWTLDAAAPTYTFAFAVSDFAVTSTALADTLPIRYYMLDVDSAQAVVLDRTPQILAYFSHLLGPYAFDQYASVQIPFGFGGMENASTVFLQAQLFDTGGAEAVQVHEAAHQWFGNRVVIAEWRDLWLSEGFATYLTTLFYEYADGVEEAHRLRADMAEVTEARRRTHRPLVPAGPVDPNEHLTWVPYQKGASVLHLLRLRMGDEAFFQALRDVYEQYEGRPLSTAELHGVLEEAGGVDLDALFDYWVYGDALPALETAWSADTRTLRWTVRDDDGTLDDVPFLLEVRQGGRIRYVAAAAGEVALDGTDRPMVRPVGVMMEVAQP